MRDQDAEETGEGQKTEAKSMAVSLKPRQGPHREADCGLPVSSSGRSKLEMSSRKQRGKHQVS